jgi:hypothetical protein
MLIKWNTNQFFNKSFYEKTCDCNAEILNQGLSMESQTNFMIYDALIMHQKRLISDPTAQSMLNVKKVDEGTRDRGRETRQYRAIDKYFS